MTKKISLIIPAKNEVESLETVLLEVKNNNLIGEITRSDVFRITIIPIYVMVVSNLVNMHSGYNGLQSGLSSILIITLCIKSFLDGTLNHILPVGSILGAILAFYMFNRYPSKVFEGNIGSLFFWFSYRLNRNVIF